MGRTEGEVGQGGAVRWKGKDERRGWKFRQIRKWMKVKPQDEWKRTGMRWKAEGKLLVLREEEETWVGGEKLTVTEAGKTEAWKVKPGKTEDGKTETGKTII